MKGYDPAQLPAWYLTIDELAAHWKCSRDRVLYCADAGVVTPAALVPKAALPFSRPGPSPFAVVMLDHYCSMDWRPEGDTMVAPLVGEFRTYHVVRDTFESFVLAGCDDVFVDRRSLVIPLDQADDLSNLVARRSALRSDERRTLLLVLGACLAGRPDADQPYTIASDIGAELWAVGVEISERTIADKAREAIELYTQLIATAA